MYEGDLASWTMCISGGHGLMAKLGPLCYYYVHWISADNSVRVLKRNLIDLLAFLFVSSLCPEWTGPPITCLLCPS